MMPIDAFDQLPKDTPRGGIPLKQKAFYAEGHDTPPAPKSVSIWTRPDDEPRTRVTDVARTPHSEASEGTRPPGAVQDATTDQKQSEEETNTDRVRERIGRAVPPARTVSEEETNTEVNALFAGKDKKFQ